MQDTDAPGLEVGFAINFGDAFGQLRSLDDILGETAARAVREFKQVEAATAGLAGGGLASAVRGMETFGNAATRELANVAKATKQAEKSAEDMTRQVQRQIDVFGKSTSEIRQMRVEMKALAAEKLGMTAAAAELRTAGAEMDRLEASTGRLAVAGGRSRGSMTQLSFQLNDVATMAAMGAKPMQIFASQAGQIFQVAQMAEGGVKGFGSEVVAMTLRFAPFIAAAAVAAAGLGVFVHWASEGVTNEQLTSDLGKITGGADATKAELWKLRDATISWGDVTKALFSEVGKDIAEQFVGDMKQMGASVHTVLDNMATYGRMTMAGMYAGLAGTKAYMGEISSLKGLGNLVTGDPTLIDRTYGEAYRKADKYLSSLGARVKKQAVDNARHRLAESIGYNNIPKPPKERVDHHAETLARDAAAVEAQIRNLYKLGDAYAASGADALMAEARVKAESDAIRKRGDIEAAVERQVRLAIAQRVSDAEKGAATTRDQARIQAEVNAQVANGLVPAAAAADLVREQIAELPLQAALKVAEQRGYKLEIEKATAALQHQREAQASTKAAATGDFFVQAHDAAEKQLKDLGEQLRLVGATNDERVRAMATMKATRDLEAHNQQLGTTYANQFIADQVEIAVRTDRVTSATALLNDELSFAADKWDLIAGKVQDAGRGMADAFGSAGQAISDLASIYAGFQSDRARLDQQHAAKVKDLAGKEGALARENAKFAIQSSGAQITAYGDMAGAAKGFFKEGSAGYEALAAAEKVYRVAQFAMSLAAMVQNALETTGVVTGAAAKATAEGAVGIAKQSQAVFPYNIIAMAATGAALVAAGIGVGGGFGGGSGAKVDPGNVGAGTVLGDSTKQSESIKNALAAIKEVDTLMLLSSHQMAASLKSIDGQIGGVAALVTRAGNVNADASVTTGFKTNAIGSVLGAIPLVGGFLQSLFGSTTTVTGNGLFGGPQSLGSILGGGFNAQYYSDVQKKSKFLGITTGTKYSTQYSGADAGLTNQFTLILKSFDDAILAAAGPLGAATADIQNQLNGFVLNLGKVDLKGLTGEQIQEKLSAIFGAAADQMAAAAFPGMERFQRVGEGTFETLIRVASTVETVTASLDQLGLSARALGIDAKMGIAGQFDSLGDLTSATDAYFTSYYSKAEQAAAKAAQLGTVFGSMGLAMPATLDAFRQLVEVQDLTKAAGQATYATLLQLAPAFADLKAAMDGAKSAADVLSERAGLGTPAAGASRRHSGAARVGPRQARRIEPRTSRAGVERAGRAEGGGRGGAAARRMDLGRRLDHGRGASHPRHYGRRRWGELRDPARPVQRGHGCRTRRRSGYGQEPARPITGAAQGGGRRGDEPAGAGPHPSADCSQP